MNDNQIIRELIHRAAWKNKNLSYVVSTFSKIMERRRRYAEKGICRKV